MYMNRRKWEHLILSGATALIASVGIFFGALCLFHIDVMDCDPAKTACVFAALSGSIWCMLLFRKY